MAEQELDRSEEATPFKRQEARKKGTVAKSQDVGAAVTVLGLLIVVMFFGQKMVLAVLGLIRQFWMSPVSAMEEPALFGQTVALLFWQVLLALSPLWGILVVFALVSGAAQVGIVISAEPMKPDWKKLNPVTGFKRLFSWKLLFEGVKTTIKFTLFVSIIYWAVKGIWPKLLFLPQSNNLGMVKTLGEGSQTVMQRMLIAMIFIAFLDWIYVRYDVGKKLRMSRRELKDEVKRREGDPRIKAKLRELRMQFLQRSQSVSKVKDADVLIVNPQHLAVAVKYDRKDMMAPQVLAKGAGELALKMREVARRKGIPILENKPLARSLFRDVKINDWVHEEYYAAVARALVWAFRIRYGKAVLEDYQ